MPRKPRKRTFRYRMLVSEAVNDLRRPTEGIIPSPEHKKSQRIELWLFQLSFEHAWLLNRLFVWLSFPPTVNLSGSAVLNSILAEKSSLFSKHWMKEPSKLRHMTLDETKMKTWMGVSVSSRRFWNCIFSTRDGYSWLVVVDFVPITAEEILDHGCAYMLVTTHHPL